jgi:hypothetical protein
MCHTENGSRDNSDRSADLIGPFIFALKVEVAGSQSVEYFMLEVCCEHYVSSAV